MGTPTRFTYGVATVAKGKPLSSYPLPDPFHSSSDQGYGVATYSNDFTTYAGEYTTTGTGSTTAITSGAGGVITITPGGASTVTTAYKTAPVFQFIPGQQGWFETRVAPSAVPAGGSFSVGMQAGSSASDSILFTKGTGSTTINLTSTVASTTTTLATNVATASANTYVDLALHYTSQGDLEVFSNGNLVSRVTSPTVGTSGTTITSQTLGPVFQITPTASETLSIDYVLSALELSR
jgi:hypothetical protein